MQASLEIQSGPRAGETIVVKEGVTITVGRTTSADFPLPQDTFLSRVHFAVECNGSGCRLIDRQSANGTLLNNVKISGSAEVHEGDVILAGQTNFVVHLTAPAATAAKEPAEPITDRPHPIQQPKPPAYTPAFKPSSSPKPASRADTLAVGSWFFAFIPEGWVVVEDFGLRRRERNAFPSEVTASEAVLAVSVPLNEAFEQYVNTQIEQVKFLAPQLQIQPVSEPAAIRGTEETKAFIIRYKTDDGRRFLQRQIYARSGPYAGALTLTTLENEAPAVQLFFDQILRGLAFRRLSAG